MEAVVTSLVDETSQKRHEGGAPYHRTVLRATGLWIVVSTQVNRNLPWCWRGRMSALAARS